MAQTRFAQVDEWHRKFIEEQHVFFVGTAARNGKVMVEDGEFFGVLSDSKYVKRSVPQGIREAPAL